MTFRRFDVYPYTFVDTDIAIHRYDTFEALCSEYSGKPIEWFDQIIWPGTPKGVNYAEFSERVFKYPEQQCWGFCSEDRKIINVWFSKHCDTRYLMGLLAHELGHTFDDKMKPSVIKQPEAIAMMFESVALLAWDTAQKLQKEFFYGIA